MLKFLKQTKSSVSYIGKEYKNDECDTPREKLSTVPKNVRFSEESQSKLDKKEQTVEEKEVNTDKV